MVGFAEVFLTAFFAIGVVLAVVGLRRFPMQTSAPSPALATPVVASIAVCAMAAGMWWSTPFAEALLPHLANRTGAPILDPPNQRLGWAPSALLGTWLATPPAASLLWLLLPTNRRLGPSALLGGLMWCAFSVGAGVGLWVVGLSFAEQPTPDAPPLLGATALLNMAARAGLGLGFSAVLTVGVWFVAASSASALRAVLITTAAMPCAALALAALLTPPDVVSQLMLATCFGTGWLIGLVLGALTGAARQSLMIPFSPAQNQYGSNRTVR
jgi:hypothetical protein